MTAAFQGWAILELMGHRQRAGMVQEVELFGGKLLRIDCPLPPAGPGEQGQERHCGVAGEAASPAGYISEFYGAGSIYALRPVTEDVARAFAGRLGDPRPVQPVGFRLEDHRVHGDDEDEPF